MIVFCFLNEALHYLGMFVLLICMKSEFSSDQQI